MTVATREVQPSDAGSRPILARRCNGPAAATHVPAEDPVACAARAGLMAVWTGDCSASVELARLSGPRAGLLTASDAGRLGVSGRPPLSLSDPVVRAAIYQRCLVSGTQFDIYRWVNLIDLAGVWPLLRLPDGISDEWSRVLTAAQLLDPSRARASAN